MSSKIEQMSMLEIVKKIGFPSDFKEFESTYKYNSKEEDIAEFKNQIINLANTPKRKFENYMECISQNEKIFDKDLYFFHIAKLLEKDLFLSKEETARVFILRNNNLNIDSNRQALYNAARKLLSTVDVVDIVTTQNNNGELEYNITSSKEFSSQKNELEKQKQFALARIEEIENKVGLDNVLQVFCSEDILEICKYKNLGEFLYNLLQNNIEELKSIIINNIEYIDLDKMLILSGEIQYNKFLENIREKKFEDLIDLNSFIENIDSLLENKKIIVTLKRLNIKVNLELVKEKIDILYNHFINGKYYTNEEIKDLSQKIISGEVSVSILSKEEFIYIMKFTPEERKKIIANNSEAIEYFIKNQLATPEELKEPIVSGESTNSKQLFAVFSTGIISGEEIVDLYINKKIDLLDIKRLKKQLDDEKSISEIVSSKKLINLFLTGKREEFLAYRNLYKALKIEGADTKTKNNISAEILEILGETLKDKVYELYYMGLITYDSLKNSFKENSSRILKPADIKNIDDLKILSDSEISNNEKVILLYSIYSDSEDNEIRDNLINKVLQNQKINFDEETFKIWNLIKDLDSDYSQKYLKNDYIIFYLPNKEKYIIQKMFDSNLRNAYGAATYILDEIEFEKNRDLLITKDNKLNKIALINIEQENNAIKKILYSGKNNSIMKYFDMGTLNQQYTKEQLKTIKNIVKQVK